MFARPRADTQVCPYLGIWRRKTLLMTTNTNEEARVRGYLLSQGERYSYMDMWPRCVKARLEEHLGEIPGVKVKIKQFSSISEAQKAEQRAIKSKQPPRNKQGT